MKIELNKWRTQTVIKALADHGNVMESIANEARKDARELRRAADPLVEHLTNAMKENEELRKENQVLRDRLEDLSHVESDTILRL